MHRDRKEQTANQTLFPYESLTMQEIANNIQRNMSLTALVVNDMEIRIVTRMRRVHTSCPCLSTFFGTYDDLIEFLETIENYEMEDGIHRYEVE